ncbi:MAG: ribosome silencing factor [Lachnospiraceae bacterium]|nr:ribosome silencing factor [Lachnospiraceae bacterium]
MEPHEIVDIAVTSLENKKAEHTRVIDIHKISSLADFFIVTNGTNPNQMQAMVDQVTEDLAKKDCMPKHIEGNSSSNWILIDYGDVVIHVFDRESRNFYDLEHIWKDGAAYERAEVISQV